MRELSSSVATGEGIFILDGDRTTGYSNNESLNQKRAATKKQSTPNKQKAKAPKTNLNVNERLVRFCRLNLGRKIGNGQCSELAVLGLPASGGVLDFNNLWGRNIGSFEAFNGRPVVKLGPAGTLTPDKKRVELRPGDIIQYENVRFLRQWKGGYSEKTYPHHTSVISQVSKDGQSIKVYEQNVNNTQIVVETSLYLPELNAGSMRISRPIPR